MKGTFLIPAVSLICFATIAISIATSPLQTAASAVATDDEVGVGVRDNAGDTITCAVISSECEDNKRCCSFNCVNGICTCVHKGARCTIDSDCCNLKSGAKCKSGKCSA